MKNRLWIGIALLVLASLACSLGGAGNEGTTAPATGGGTGAQPTGPSATEPPAGGEPAPEVTAGALDNLDSYRLRMTWEWHPDSGAAETMVMETEATRDPAARRIMMTSGSDTIEMVQIGDTSWTCMMGSCMQTEATEDMMEEFGSEIDFDPGVYTSGTDYDYVGTETVNGVRARHYRLNLTAAEVSALAAGALVSDVQADIWITDQSGLPEYATRFAMSWREDRSGTQGNARMVYDVYDVNAPITIEPPAGAMTGLPEGLPEYPGATGLTLMEGFISFNTTDDLAAVADFYRNQLPANGWTNQSDQEMGSIIMQTWSDGTRTLNIMISPGQEGGSSVVLTLE